MLIDIRHEPKDTDIQMYEFAKYWNIPVSVIATKSDKLKRSQLQKHTSAIRKGLKLAPEEKIYPLSSLNKTGQEAVWEQMKAIYEEHGVLIDSEEENEE